MRKQTVVILTALLCAAGTAHADTGRLKSKVADVNTTAGYLKLFHLNKPTNNVEEIKVNTGPNTRYEGADSLRDISAGDEVMVEFNHDPYSNDWQALEIELVQKREPPFILSPGGFPSAPPLSGANAPAPIISPGMRLFQNEVEETRYAASASKETVSDADAVVAQHAS